MAKGGELSTEKKQNISGKKKHRKRTGGKEAFWGVYAALCGILVMKGQGTSMPWGGSPLNSVTKVSHPRITSHPLLLQAKQMRHTRFRCFSKLSGTSISCGMAGRGLENLVIGPE